MSDEDQINRRSLLKTVAGGGGIALGMANTTSAFSSASVGGIDGLLQDEKVQSIVEAIPNLHLKTNKAEAMTTLKEYFTLYRIPTNLGLLAIIEFTESDHCEAIFKFDSYMPHINFNWPRGTDAMLIGADDGAVLHRTATIEETRKTLDAIGKEDGDFYVGTDSESKGFRAVSIDSSEKMVKRFEVQRKKVDGKSSTSEFKVVSMETISADEKSDATTAQGGCPDCDLLLGNLIIWLHSLSGCGLCWIAGLALPALIACVIAIGCIGIPDLVNMGCLSTNNIPCLVECTPL